MKKKAEKPLITFVLFAYNQERFIREAVEGALAQDYSPLEIIISDDCSTDLTFSIINEMVESYNGQHHIIVNRNESNLGIGGHINKLVKLASGDLIVMAAGDDISCEGRCTIVKDSWLKYGKPFAIESGVNHINQEGGEIYVSEDIVKENYIFNDSPAKKQFLIQNTIRKKHSPHLGVRGCALAYSKDVFSKFLPLNLTLVTEDYPLTLRAMYLGDFIKIPNKLVKYRKHDTNLFNRTNFNSEIMIKKCSFKNNEHLKKKQSSLKDIEYDLEYAISKKYIENVEYSQILNDIKKKIEVLGVKCSWWSLNPLTRFFRGIPRIIKNGNSTDLIWCVKRLIPLWLFLFVIQQKQSYLRAGFKDK